jgi:hypothetical protein
MGERVTEMQEKEVWGCSMATHPKYVEEQAKSNLLCRKILSQALGEDIENILMKTEDHESTGNA